MTRHITHDALVDPPEGDPVELASLASAAPHWYHRATSRLDPFWHGMADWTHSASWESRELAGRLADAGLCHLSNRDARLDPEGARTRAAREPVALESLGAVAMWRTLTADQVAAFAGWVPPELDAGGPSALGRWRDTPRWLRNLWAAGLVERGTINSKRPGLPYLYRPIRSPEVEHWVAQLPLADRLALTAGQPWTEGPRYAERHNLIAAEMGLRLAEFCEIGTVLGEAVGGHHLLDVTGQRDKTGSDAADLVIVRPDGLRVAVEMTMGRSGLERKVARTIDLLCETDFDESGTMVLFVEAASPYSTMQTTVWNRLRRVISEQVAARPDGPARRLAERIAVARWSWWFPGPGLVHPSFVSLACHRPTGTAAGRWRRADLLDVIDVGFSPADDGPLDVLANAACVAGVPHWLRTGTGTLDVTGFALEHIGLAGGPLDPRRSDPAAASPDQPPTPAA